MDVTLNRKFVCLSQVVGLSTTVGEILRSVLCLVEHPHDL